MKKLLNFTTNIKRLGGIVKTGPCVWNQMKPSLTEDPSKGIPLIYSSNIKDKKISSNEVTSAYIERSKKSKHLNSYNEETFDTALKKAQELGVDQDEFEMILDAKLHMTQKANIQAAAPPPPLTPVIDSTLLPP